ncbi:hypothetical protein CGRA01v4_02499 [Colletotrichum graminicola]|nr:hypothetical protein CGRA01v4_02499 [Colletotrichum graminicola]
MMFPKLIPTSLCQNAFSDQIVNLSCSGHGIGEEGGTVDDNLEGNFLGFLSCFSTSPLKA